MDDNEHRVVIATSLEEQRRHVATFSGSQLGVTSRGWAHANVSDVALGDCGCEPCDAVGVLEQHKSSLAAAGRIQASVTLSP